MAFWSGIVTVNCSACLPAPAPRGLDQRDFERHTGAASCLLLILAAIICWQIREIDRVLSEAGSDADDLNFELLSHISPIGWDNVLLYGEYQLNRSLVRSERLSV